MGSDALPASGDDEMTGDSASGMTINDLPMEVLLKILAEVSDVSRGLRMYIFDFPRPAAVCWRWFDIYFEMYWKRWGFLHGREALMEEWKHLAAQRNMLPKLPNPDITLHDSSFKDTLAPETPSYSKLLPKHTLELQPNFERPSHRSKTVSISIIDRCDESDKELLFTSKARLKRHEKAPSAAMSKRQLRKRSRELCEKLLKQTLSLRKQSQTVAS